MLEHKNPFADPEKEKHLDKPYREQFAMTHSASGVISGYFLPPVKTVKSIDDFPYLPRE